MKHPEDKYIFGESGYYYVRYRKIEGGYFYYLHHARSFARSLMKDYRT